MESKDKILDEMKKQGTPMSAGQIAEATGIDRKEVDKAMKKLKDSGEIVSPKRCFWEPAQ
ncbi:MAG: HTH domain-containing protein [Ignavibacteria bacterium]|jgi:biotin operon repressor|nr:HTH domain-containing protein [Ignavibacteria bacterium]